MSPVSASPRTRLRLCDGDVVDLPREVYLSAAMPRAAYMRTCADALHARGLRSVSSWLHAPTDEATEEAQAQAAVQDELDMDRAGLFLAFTEGPGQWTGGRHVELGYALAHAKTIVVIGPPENVFHFHPAILARFATFRAFLDALEVPYA